MKPYKKREPSGDIRRAVRVLEESNGLLKELLEHMKLEKDHFKQQVLTNIEKILLPQVRKLKKRGNGRENKDIAVLERSLEAIGSAFGQRLSSRHLRLTPKEIEIANMIKAGLTSKEMARTLGVSPLTVDTHRSKIRRKFHITQKRVNLATFLQNI